MPVFGMDATCQTGWVVKQCKSLHRKICHDLLTALLPVSTLEQY